MGTDTNTNANTAAVRTLARLARMLEHACEELTLPQYRLLAMVECGDERASHLAGRLALSKPTVTAVVDGLVERGLLARSEVASDRRVVRLTLTPAGRRSLALSEAAMSGRLAQVVAKCGDPTEVMSALGQLGLALDANWAQQVGAGERVRVAEGAR